ncbi:hydantoinase/oxoprolinase family protein [Alteribacillus sp. JSM 102045]|uniref:hydantoinase/oxoprolinase family protein n=1 Tax=Alteribacillus sp. JSM 102045 TaxID=1562101 RepID=UPI0035C1D0F3
MYRAAVDVGGTFTDVVLQHDDSGEIYVSKVPSIPSDQSIGLMNGMKKVCEEKGIEVQEIRSVIHGTTVATNAVLEEKGAKVGLLTTAGFEQILHVARSWTPAPITAWIGFLKPDPLADLEHTRGVKERIAANGEIIMPLDEEDLRVQIQDLYSKGIKSLTVSLINSYANSKHEEIIRSIAEEMDPSIPVSISTDILPEFREYERTLTTVMNAYVRPPMSNYLNNMETKIKKEGMEDSRVSIVRSDGGLMSITAASQRPVHTMLSGPSGGVTASAMIGMQTGFKNVISFDMGGTSTDVSLTYNGTPNVSRETKVGVFPVKAPSLEVETVGAGGGSLAHVPQSGALRVGPQSAGSEPGPASYGKGGEEPTVTDANVVLGYLPPQLAGGDMVLDVEKAKATLRKIADELGVDLYKAAKGVYDIANENMYGALRVVSVEKGYDPREFALIPLGGAGPLFGNALADLAGTFPVVVPPTPGVLSALGFLESDIRNEYSKTYIRLLSELDENTLIGELEKLGRAADDWLHAEAVPKENQNIAYEVDVRYYRQGHEIPLQVELPTLWEEGVSHLKNRFDDIHEQIYGFKMDIEIEVVNFRAVAVGTVRSPEQPINERGGVNAEHAVIDGSHEAYFDGTFHKTPLYDRTKLQPGNIVYGPAIVTQKDSTTLILPTYIGEVDEYMNLIISKGEK